MNPPPRHLRLLLGGVAVLALLSLLVADWNWARPMVVQYLRHTSQRDVRVDDLQIRLDADWRPVVRLRGVHVANASWAGTKPFAVAEEVRMTFAWASLLSRPRVVTELALVGADVDMQRQADGLRNWRLTRPDDRGPARMRIQRLRAERSVLRFTHRGVGLKLQATSTPLTPALGPYTQQIDFEGDLHGAVFSGSAHSGPVMSMLDSSEYFPLRGQARAGETRLTAEGRVADLVQLSRVDAQVQLQGETLAELQAFLPRPEWPASKPYRVQGRLLHEGPGWTAQGAQLTLGRSDLSGDARYTPSRVRHDGRGELQATLQSRLLRVDDLPLKKLGTASGASAPASSTRVLPQKPLPLEGLRSLDGSVDVKVAQLQGGAAGQGGTPLPTARDVKARATLDRGQLNLRLMNAELGGGTWQGRLALNAQAGKADIQLQLEAHGLNLQKLWPPLGQQAGVQWPAIDGRIALNGHGASLANWLGSATGRVDVALSGGSLSRKLDSRLGLDAGRMVGALFRGDAAVPIRCGAVSFAFADGVGRSRQLVLETDRTHVEGQASVHLAEETWAMVLTPQAQGDKVSLVVPASIVAQGTFRKLNVELAQRERVTQAERGSCG
ncbi:MAG: AsmA family protein [Rhizobacter sp.]